MANQDETSYCAANCGGSASVDTNVLNSVTGKRSVWVFPGQGSQAKGMGAELFGNNRDLLRQADGILGYSVEQLCEEGPVSKLNQTQYTQPVLFTVCALQYYENLRNLKEPDFVAGHSLGEYCALLAAGVFDFKTGLRLVQHRGLLMSQAGEGGMAAVINLPLERLRSVLDENEIVGVDIANYNTPSQIVLSGNKSELGRAAQILGTLDNVRVVPLPVSGAFHSHLMQAAQLEFTEILDQIKFAAPKIPVLSNVTARPHRREDIAGNLARQITQQVNWVDSIRFLMGRGVVDFKEVGPGKVLSGMVASIRQQSTPLSSDDDTVSKKIARPLQAGLAQYGHMGSQAYRDDHQTAHAYAVGSVAGGITSEALVARAAQSGILAYFGSGDIPFDELERILKALNGQLGENAGFGVSLDHHPDNPVHENRLVDMYLSNRINRLEALRFTRITTALVKYRVAGLRRGSDGKVFASNKIMARISRFEHAEAFMMPAPRSIVADLLERAEITSEQADWSRSIPMVDDLCVNCNGDGLSGSRSLFHLLPAVLRLRTGSAAIQQTDWQVRVGVAGGLGTPEAMATAYMIGADFVVTLSINQATVEAGLSPASKDLLADLTDRDIGIAPVEHLFEHGATALAVRRGVLFPARAAKLYRLNCHCRSLEQIDHSTLKEIEAEYFQADISDVLRDIDFMESVDSAQVITAERLNPKYKMLQLFKWYLRSAARWARSGSSEHKSNHAIYCGDAMIGFNQWANGSDLQHWQNRHVDNIALSLIEEAAHYVDRQRKPVAQAV